MLRQAQHEERSPLPYGRNTITAGVPKAMNLPVNFGTPPAPMRNVLVEAARCAMSTGGDELAIPGML